jgi:hypothetical protein
MQIQKGTVLSSAASKKNVSRFLRLRRVLNYGAVSLVLVCLIAVAALHVQERILRYRAEKLLADIQSLELRKASFADARDVFRRWGKWGEFDRPCRPAHCNLQITLSDFPYDLPEKYAWRISLHRAAMFVGAHPARVTATIVIDDAIVWGKGFDVGIDAPPYAEAGGLATDNDYMLAGSAESRSRFDAFDRPATVLLHPNYVIGKPSGCEICVAVYAEFTPYADSHDVQRLMQFNFSCLTRWKPCRTQNDIMPVAWREYVDDHAKIAAANPQRECGPKEVALLGRDAENAAVVDVIANRNESLVGNERFRDSTVRLSKRLKRTTFWNPGESREMSVHESEVGLVGSHSLDFVKPGARIITLFNYSEVDGSILEQCGVVPFTPQNLALVKRGVDQDHRAVFEDDKSRPRFQVGSMGDGTIDGGGTFSFDSYKSPDGVVVGRSVDRYDSPKKAREKMDELVHDAIKVIERGRERPDQGDGNGERYVISIQYKGREKPVYLVFWQDGSAIYLLQSACLVPLRSFEDSIY